MDAAEDAALVSTLRQIVEMIDKRRWKAKGCEKWGESEEISRLEPGLN